MELNDLPINLKVGYGLLYATWPAFTGYKNHTLCCLFVFYFESNSVLIVLIKSFEASRIPCIRLMFLLVTDLASKK